MNQQHIVIWGAGKIGRGFIGHLFHRAGWEVTLVDADRALVERLQRASSYTVHLSRTPADTSSYVVSGYQACASSSPEAIQALGSVSLVALAVFADAFESAAQTLALEIVRRSSLPIPQPLDILICANTLHAAHRLRQYLAPLLTPPAMKWFERHVGLVESIVLRVAVQPSEAQKQADALCVMTNGYPDLSVDRAGFKGVAPQLEGLVLSDAFAAEETRKLYTYNLLHAVYAYLGDAQGYGLVSQACADPRIDLIARGALRESGRALCREFGFDESGMVAWNAQAIADLTNPILGDTLERLGADPARKLARSDRLIGPALLCLRHGIYPYHLCSAIAAAVAFGERRGAWVISCENDVRQTVRTVCGLSRTPELVQMVVERYREFGGKGAAALSETARQRVAAAYEEGFRCEKTYKGCAQCTLLALSNTVTPVGDELFEAASGLSGGMGLCGDGVCGGYSGGIMFMGTRAGRRRNHLDNGDKDLQYKSYEMAQKLHDRFMETYGSVLCSDIHKQIFGEAFCLRTKPIREQFEAAGAHTDKCTGVIALASGWVAELLMEEG